MANIFANSPALLDFEEGTLGDYDALESEGGASQSASDEQAYNGTYSHKAECAGSDAADGEKILSWPSGNVAYARWFIYITGITISEPEDAAGGGRKIAVSAITDGTVACTGTVTATHWALTNGTDTLYATGSLSSSQQVTDGNTFTLTAFDITVPDATSE